ncbi:MAG: amidase [Pseudomonadota bacterium]
MAEKDIAETRFELADPFRAGGPVFSELFDLSDGDGPLVVVKDVLDVAGRPTRASSRAFAGAAPAARDSDVVARLKAKGARLVGKAQLHELAYGLTGVNLCTGAPPNPRFPDYVPGGSSSGSASAAAAGHCDFAIGTDTGGSIRVPAACCGVFGLKPTFGRVSRAGATPARSSLDCVGPLAADPSFLAEAMAMIAPDWRADAVKPTALRVGWGAFGADPEVASRCRSALQAFGGEAAEIDIASFDAAYEAGLAVISRETFEAFGALLDGGLISDDVAPRLAKGRLVTDAQIAEAEDVRRRFTDDVDAALTGLDLIATPTLPCAPPKLSEAGDLMKSVPMSRLVRPFNLSGHPALSIPLGALETGAPVALQLIARKGDDERLVAAAQVWADRAEAQGLVDKRFLKGE